MLQYSPSPHLTKYSARNPDSWGFPYKYSKLKLSLYSMYVHSSRPNLTICLRVTSASLSYTSTGIAGAQRTISNNLFSLTRSFFQNMVMSLSMLLQMKLHTYIIKERAQASKVQWKDKTGTSTKLHQTQIIITILIVYHFPNV